MVKGTFREDLYYRLNVVSIHIPPLRERKEDIPALIDYFINRFNLEFKKKILGVTPEALRKMVSYHWPGNVRQLENVIKKAVVLCHGEWILEDQILLELREERKEAGEIKKKTFEDLLNSLFEELLKVPSSNEDLDLISFLEKEIILRALQKTNGNQVQAAKLLGINRNTLRSKMERYRIKKEVLISESSQPS